jgi:cytochrome c-type biogenesis protein CcmH/NrfG
MLDSNDPRLNSLDSPLYADPARRAFERREAALQAAKERRQRGEETEEEYNNRYKEAKSKWVRTMIALPILLVTSYYLFERLALGKEAKTLPERLQNSDITPWKKEE